MTYKMPEREENSNKGTFGKILNISGSKNYIGAAYLSSASALKTGGGFLALASENKVINSVSKLLPEAVYISRKQAIKDIQNFNVMLIGCGIGTGFKAKREFKKFISLARKYNIPTIIDADGLNILAVLDRIKLPLNTVITPHPMEASRLLKTELNYILDNMEECAKLLSKKYNCTVVLKSHRTIICENEKLFINQHGNSALAKAGTGDVLAGIISGLTAQKMTLFDAGKLGVYLHSKAGEIASEELTEYSVLASELIQYIPKAIKEII